MIWRPALEMELPWGIVWPDDRTTPAIACAGPDLTGAPGEEVTLQGRCSVNPYGPWWRMARLLTQPDGQNIALSDATVGKPTFIMPSGAAPGTAYTFTPTVTDKDGESEAPFFAGPSATRAVAENSPAETSVGAPVTAADPDAGDTLSYSLAGTDANAFAINANTGQLLTIDGVTYDYEIKSSYSLSVLAMDGGGLLAGIAVTINLADVEEGHLPPESSQYSPFRPTKLDKIKNLHSTDSKATENLGMRGRSIWVR